MEKENIFEYYIFQFIQSGWKFNFSYNIDGLRFEMAWEVAGHKELQALSKLKSSLSIKSNQKELDHALQYFQHSIKDFPGEFFLQTPFVFMVTLFILKFNHNGRS